MFGCEYCHWIEGHSPRCPKYKPPKTRHYCSICGEGIYSGEEYIENDNNEYICLYCAEYGRDLVEFLGYKIRTMEDESE